MVPDENSPAVPELARRATLSSCRHDPVRAFVPVLTAMPAARIGLGDVLADSGYAHQDADAWALPLRAAGAALVQDLHPHDRGPKGTHHGAIISNGCLYCPGTPRALLELGPLARDAAPEQAAAHDSRTAELARYCCPALKIPILAAFTMPMKNRAFRAVSWGRCRSAWARCRT
jgi:hypothetical protein